MMSRINILLEAGSITTVRIKTVLHAALAIAARKRRKKRKRRKIEMAKRTSVAAIGALMAITTCYWAPSPQGQKEPWPHSKRNKPLRKKKKSKK